MSAGQIATLVDERLHNVLATAEVYPVDSVSRPSAVRLGHVRLDLGLGEMQQLPREGQVDFKASQTWSSNPSQQSRSTN